MPLTVKHAKTSAIADDPAAVAAGEVVPSDWNADHTLTGLPAGDIVGTTDTQTLTNKTLGVTVVDVNSTSDALRITQAGTGNALVVEDSTNPDSTPTVIDTNGNVVLGKSARQSSGVANKIEVHSNTSTDNTRPNLGLYHWATSASTGPNLTFFHYPSGTVGTTSTNSTGDQVGVINFAVFDGTTTRSQGITAVAASTTTIRVTHGFAENYFTNAIRVGTTSNYVGLTYTGTGTTTYSIPATDGTNGQVLTTNGSGTLSWTTPSGSGTVTSIVAGTGLSGGTITGSGTIALDINSLSLASTPGTGDTFPVYSGAATKKASLASAISAFTSLSSVTPAADDKVVIYDTSGTLVTNSGAAELASLAPCNAGYRAGDYYAPWGFQAGGNTTTASASRIVYLPILIGKKTTFTRIVYETTVGAAGAQARLGVYNASGGIPTTKVFETSASTGVQSAAVTEVTISQTLEPGAYFLAFITDGTPTMRVLNFNATTSTFMMGMSATNSQSPLGFNEAGSGIVLPATAGTLSFTTTNANTIGIWLKA